MRATAISHPNIALIKYWGKRDGGANLPAVGSLSITLSGMSSRTTVAFDAARDRDEVLLNGKSDATTAARVSECLDVLRHRAGVRHGARVTSTNDFPTGAGLASSASGFAALAVAANAALGLELPQAALTDVARLGSGSAPRSLFGGFALLENQSDGGVRCGPWLEASAWPLRVLVAITKAGPKETSSRDGMAQSRTTSPLYAEWVRSHPADLERGKALVHSRDFMALAELAEHNCLKMHAVMLTTQPPLLYWEPATVECMQVVRELRAKGTAVFYTIDAGPQLKAVCLPGAVEQVRAALAAVPGVTSIIDCALGAGARVVVDGVDG